MLEALIELFGSIFELIAISSNPKSVLFVLLIVILVAIVVAFYFS